MRRKLLAEYFGTFALVFAGTGAIVSGARRRSEGFQANDLSAVQRSS